MLFGFLSISIALTAQEKAPVTFGKVTKEDFSIQSPLVNSNTSAVVIADVGSTNLKEIQTDGFPMFSKGKRE